MSGRRALVVRDDQGNMRTVGPVLNEASVSKLVAEVQAAGWTHLVTCRHLSAADFRAEMKGRPGPADDDSGYREACEMEVDELRAMYLAARSGLEG
jgi:hypothetical protein